jgi:hypothetical protein
MLTGYNRLNMFNMIRFMIGCALVFCMNMDHLYCNVNGQSVAKQRLGKQISTIERLFSVGSATRPLLCSGSVKTFQQWKTVFSTGSVQRSYLKNKRRYGSILSSEFSVGDSQEKFVDL